MVRAGTWWCAQIQRRRTSDGNRIRFTPLGRNWARRGLEPSPANLPRSIKHNLHGAPSSLSQILRSEERRQVREQLIRLPEKYKVPLLLRYYKRMTYSEIARTLNRGLPAVKIMIFRAKDQLRRNLLGLKRPQVTSGSRLIEVVSSVT